MSLHRLHLLLHVLPGILALFMGLAAVRHNLRCRKAFRRRLRRIGARLDKVILLIYKAIADASGTALDDLQTMSRPNMLAVLHAPGITRGRRKTLMRAIRAYDKAADMHIRAERFLTYWCWLPLCDIVYSLAFRTKHSLELAQHVAHLVESTDHHPGAPPVAG